MKDVYWKYDGQYIVHTVSEEVLELRDLKDTEEQNLFVGKRGNGLNQKWKIVYLDSVTEQTKGLNKYFNFYVNRPFLI